MSTEERLFQDLRAACSGVECLELLAESRGVFGFAIVGFRDQVDTPVAPRLADATTWARRFGWPQDFLNGWLRNGLASHFPLQDRPLEPDTVVHWTLPESHPTTTRGLTARQAAGLSYLRRHGVSEGVTVPVRRPFGRIGCLSWMAPTLSVIEPQQLERMRGFGREFFEIFDHCGGWRASGPLSPRALECLQLAAGGLSDRAIAQRIDRSVETVRFHMKTAIRQLDAVNRTHAVALATRAGLLAAPDPAG